MLESNEYPVPYSGYFGEVKVVGTLGVVLVPV